MRVYSGGAGGDSVAAGSSEALEDRTAAGRIVCQSHTVERRRSPPSDGKGGRGGEEADETVHSHWCARKLDNDTHAELLARG